MPRLNPRRLVFLDETWAKTNMVRLRGRAPCGRRLIEAVPHGHWKTTTLLMGLRAAGPVAPLVVDGAINGDIFRAWVEQHLSRELRSGDLVILDNLSAHKVVGVQNAITRVGAQVCYLPPYSPDFNPIENAFSKLKSLLRTAARRTQQGLWDTIGLLLDAFPADECLRYIRHAGYGKRRQPATPT
jgi:transposase